MLYLFLIFAFSQACQFPTNTICNISNISGYYYISGTTYANSNVTISIPTLDPCDCIQTNNFSFKFYSLVGPFNFSLYTEPMSLCNNRCTGTRDLLYSGKCSNSTLVSFQSDKPELVHYTFRFDLKKGVSTSSSCVSKSNGSSSRLTHSSTLLLVLLFVLI